MSSNKRSDVEVSSVEIETRDFDERLTSKPKEVESPEYSLLVLIPSQAIF